jgi:hypothetical protein
VLRIEAVATRFLEGDGDLERVGQDHPMFKDGFRPVLPGGRVQAELPGVDDVAVRERWREMPERPWPLAVARARYG